MESCCWWWWWLRGTRQLAPLTEGKEYFCPRGRLWWSEHKWTRPAPGPVFFYLPIHQNAPLLKSCCWWLSRCLFYLMRFKRNEVGRQEIPSDDFLWSPSKVVIYFNQTSTSWLQWRTAAGDDVLWHTSTLAGCWGMRQWPWLHIDDSSNILCWRDSKVLALLNWLLWNLSCSKVDEWHDPQLLKEV